MKKRGGAFMSDLCEMRLMIDTSEFKRGIERMQKSVDGLNKSICWLCRVIGHKWIVRYKYSIGDRSVDAPEHLPVCARCGVANPGTENKIPIR